MSPKQSELLEKAQKFLYDESSDDNSDDHDNDDGDHDGNDNGNNYKVNKVTLISFNLYFFTLNSLIYL